MSEQKIEKLLDKMTITEQIGQLIQLSADAFQHGKAVISGPFVANHMSQEDMYNAGSVLGISGAKTVRDVQSDYLTHSRLHIPLLFMADVVHGYETIYPIPLALGATFNPELAKQTAAMAARESSAGGVHVTFAPMVDLVRDPRWGRVMESTGEDPYLNAVMAEAQVAGFQGDDDTPDQQHIAACVKHFAAYGAPEGGKEYNTVDISEWRFREQYLPAYEAAVKAKSLLVMTSFNTLFGVPATANQKLMRDILRRELDFHGVLISDWAAIAELIKHGVAGSLREAADKALSAGVDIDMMSFAYARYLAEAADLSPELTRLIRQSAKRVLVLKDTLGLFDDPFRGLNEEIEAKELSSSANRAVALKAAEESLVLLKNQGNVLPLSHSTRIALVGPVASSNDLLGSWSWKGENAPMPTLESAFRSEFASVLVASGTDYHAITKSKFNAAIAAARQQDVIVALVGLPSSESGESSSLTDLQLPAEQRQLLKALRDLNKPLIVVVVSGRPHVLGEVNDWADGLIYALFPGTMGAPAIAKLLSGAVSPSGHLPMSLPRSVGQIPVYYNHFNTGRPLTYTPTDDQDRYLSRYIDSPDTPLYPFGFGLSYADLVLTGCQIDRDTVTKDGQVRVTATVENRSEVPGTTVVQLYTRQMVGETVQPVQVQRAFKKVAVPANQSLKVEFVLSVAQLASVHLDMKRRVDLGEYQVMVGLDAANVLSTEFVVREVE
ncbi:glycoside hydrolase family 3 N-terminal domain-containing protein [Lacticaseibacillus nasuensis]|uniref:glycoside hydrolase family 3 N-terminal domain-containing protein n=1 Tax=Lacticaseibacillus nasuensis TaxID=944671 RepID=UPI002246EA76|nr:glycoside hydrolase family 3 N-terminal domain-containing protein [Lacticaseibacillus nasuensis]MCX2455061.1 glycoside hydrolase family 3 C-terminal domain-containing protein [Lacticaseibacillus nasuensis]